MRDSFVDCIFQCLYSGIRALCDKYSNGIYVPKHKNNRQSFEKCVVPVHQHVCKDVQSLQNHAKQTSWNPAFKYCHGLVDDRKDLRTALAVLPDLDTFAYVLRKLERVSDNAFKLKQRYWIGEALKKRSVL